MLNNSDKKRFKELETKEPRTEKEEEELLKLYEKRGL